MFNKHPLIVALVAGETSGDMLGASLIRTLKIRVPNARFVGIAGPLMKQAGCEAWYDIKDLEVIGIIEVFKHLRRLLYILNDLIFRFNKLQPDIFIGIDFPDFNLILEGKLKKRGIKVIHYVSPSVWAWRKQRIIKIRKSTHLVLALLPFEKILYDENNVPCRFIGHSMADAISLHPDKNAARDILGVSYDACCLALLPGSRYIEIKMLCAIFLQAAKILSHQIPNLYILVPLVNDSCREQFECIHSKVAPELRIHLFNGKSRDVMIASDVAILASGTATLECMLAKCPMVVGYRMQSCSFWLAKRLVKTKHISLPNLLAGRELIKEFLQTKCNPNALATELISLLTNDKIRKKLYADFCNLHQKIRCNADEQAADEILKLLKYQNFR